MRWIAVVLFCFISLPLLAQKTFTEAELVAVVKTYHPVARQAFLDVRIARAEVTASRGAFDPVASFDNGRKEFDGTMYYDQQWAELKIPTWYGIDVYTGIETINGNRINPEETKGRIQYVGVSVPLVQNLVIDKRRAALQQAKIFSAQTEVTRMAVVNDLVAEALQAYWQWWEQHRQLQLVQAALQNAKTRLGMVQTYYRLGERAAIDTLEAATQVQLFEQKEAEAFMQLQKSRLQLSVFLWKERDVPYELAEDIIPEVVPLDTSPALDSLLQEARVHPLLLEYDYKLSSLYIDRKLKFQSLLPQVNAKYNEIGRDLTKTFNGALFQNNYRFGISVALPLRLSEGRGEYKAATLKIEQTKLALTAKGVLIQNKVKQHYIEWQQLQVQIEKQEVLVANYQALQKGEETKFLNGESSLFLVNARELKTIEGEQKLILLNAKKQEAEVNLKWAAGLYQQ